MRRTSIARALALPLAAALAPFATAQFYDQNVEILGHFHEPGQTYNDIWGFVTDTGREIAILGHKDKTSFVETTDPANPVLLAQISGASELHRDMKTYGGYCYIVSEGGGGLQIVDIHDPDNIQLVKSWGEFSTSHNVFIDVPAALLYAAGSNRGFVVASLSDPLNPQTILVDPIDVHDLYSGEGFAHLHLLNEGRYAIFDLSQLPALVETDSVVSPGAHTHSGWVSPDRRLSVTCDEFGNGHIGIFDAFDPWNIRTVGEFDAPTQETIHNAFLVGDVVHTSWYTQGYVAADLRRPSQPRYLGSQILGGDCWGCYPFQPSHNVYCSVMQNGLWILRLADVCVEAEERPDSNSSTGRYRVRVQVTRPNGPGTMYGASLFWETDRGSLHGEVPLVPTAAEGEYVAEIPGVPAPALVHYWVEAHQDGKEYRSPPSPRSSLTFRVGEVTTLAAFDFESADDLGFTHGADHGTDDWEHASPAGQDDDPFTAHSGEKVWGTALSTSLAARSDRWLRTPPVDVTGHARVGLRFRRFLRSVPPDESAEVLVNGNTLLRFDRREKDTQWILEDHEITHLIAGAGTAQVEFRVRTKGAPSHGGLSLDDVELYALDAPSGSEPALSLLLSFSEPRSLPDGAGGSFDAEPGDLVLLDVAQQCFSPYFDASDVGLGDADVVAASLHPDGSLALAFRHRTAVPGLSNGPNGEWVQRCDLVRFVPTSVGEDTAGSFEFLFDGSDLGLTGHRIDAVSRKTAAIHFSLREDADLPGLGLVHDQDVLGFVGRTGPNTSGSLVLILDGELQHLDLPSEGIDAVDLHGTSHVALSTRGEFEIPGLAASDGDVLDLDRDTGLYTKLLDSLLLGLEGADVDALSVVTSTGH